jgi:hypothetical protein
MNSALVVSRVCVLGCLMKPTLYVLANGLAGIVLLLLLLDPTRPLAPVLLLLALAVFCALLPRFLPR